MQSLTERAPSSPRYAIYFVPAPDSDLYRFGAEFIGYDCYSGAETPKPSWCNLPKATWRELTNAPRKYGFHATLKAPFRLQPGVDEEDLKAALDAFAATARPPSPARMQLRTIGEFAALVPEEPSAALNELAADCVRFFDRFRAPLSGEERELRLAEGLNARQAAYVDRYGYPYVLEEFRFHMTLTGRIPESDRNEVVADLQRLFASALPESALSMTAVSIVRQDSGASPFRVAYQRTIGLD